MKQPSLTDVAQRAGVSAATASQAINGKGRVNAKTRLRILRVAKDLGYTANRHAISLLTGRTGILAVQIGRPGLGSILVPNLTYFTDLVNSISAAALERGWIPVVVPRNAPLADLKRLNPDCGIVIDPLGDETLLRMLLRASAPVVTTGRLAARRTKRLIEYVDNDAKAAAIAAFDHLQEAGYRRPALLVTRSTASYTLDAIKGAAQWSKRRRVPVLIFQVTDMSVSSVERALTPQLRLTSRPDCVYATDEPGAVGVLHAARAAALRVPHDFGIICGLDGPLLQDMSPSISAIDIHPELVGRQSVERLFEMTTSGAEANHISLVPFTLRARASTSREDES